MTQTRRDAIKLQHGFGDWPGADEAPLRRSFLPDLDRIPGYSHERRSAIPGSRAFIDHFGEDDGPGRISVRVVPYASARDAHEGLIDELEHSMAPRLPRCEEQGLDLADPCFCGFGTPLEFVVFARANVLIRVESAGTEPVAVTEVAAELDRQLAAAR